MQPASFALVMATGIVSLAAHLQGLERLAMVLLAANAAAWVMLWFLLLRGIVRDPAAFAAAFADHARAPGFFTAVAGTAVLASQLLVFGVSEAAAVALGVFAAVLWLALTYGIFTALTIRAAKPPLERGIGGAWLLAVVATQSLAVLAALLAAHFAQPWKLQLNFAALALWLVAGALYTWLMAVIFYRYTFLKFEPGDLAPPHWINMGAMAISTLAGSLLVLNAQDAPLLLALLPFIKGFTLLYWATGTWWIPLLVLLSVWQYGVRRYPLRYEPLFWGAVFPLGMYSACTHELGRALQLPFLAGVAAVFFWLALAAWALVAAGAVRSAMAP